MESEEIINNSYKDFGEKNSEKNNKIRLKKIIIISSIITIIIASLTIFLILYFLDKEIIECETGSFLPEDDSEKCIKCSVNNCQKCHGTKIIIYALNVYRVICYIMIHFVMLNIQ